MAIAVKRWLFTKNALVVSLALIQSKAQLLEQHMKPGEADEIIHSSLISDDFKLFASEMTGPTTIGDAIYRWLNCKKWEEIRSIFEKLSAGSNVFNELVPAYWGSPFGAVTDKFELNKVYL